MTARSPRANRNIFTSAIAGATGIIAETGRMPPLRDVARFIGVAPEQLQPYFASEAALVDAMAENALLLLHHTLVEVVARADPDDPVEQLVAVADAFVEWGFRYPREFQVIGQMPAAAFEANPMLMRYERSIQELMSRIALRALPDMAPDSAELSTFLSIAHSFAYGLVSQMLMGDLARWNPGLTDREAAARNMRVFIHQFLRPAR